MAGVHGILGREAPAAASLVVAYRVPVNKHARIKVVVANRGAADKFRIAVSPAQAIDDTHYLAYDQDIEANHSLCSVEFDVGSHEIDRGIVKVRSLNGNLTFTVSGVEEENA